MVEAEWYISRYPECRLRSRSQPISNSGIPEGRDPNRFDSAWYRRRSPRSPPAGSIPLPLSAPGAAALLDPHPKFDATWYVRQHPDAAANPVLYHCAPAGRADTTQRPIDIRDYLPSDDASPTDPPGVFVDVIVVPFRAWSRQDVSRPGARRPQLPDRPHHRVRP